MQIDSSSISFQVERRLFINADGGHELRSVVVLPNAVAILATDQEGKIILVRQQRFAVERLLKEIPAGKLEPGEEPEDCARRELIEETGYAARNLTLLAKFYSTPGTVKECIYLFFAPGCVYGQQPLDKRIEVELLSPIRVSHSLGEIEDAKSLIALLWYMKFLG